LRELKTVNLPFAPFPGLGIRVDVYELTSWMASSWETTISGLGE